MGIWTDSEAPMVVYGPSDTGAYFYRVCPICFRFVKADDTRRFNSEGAPEDVTDGTCKIHGRIKMPFEGYL